MFAEKRRANKTTFTGTQSGRTNKLLNDNRIISLYNN